VEFGHSPTQRLLREQAEGIAGAFGEEYWRRVEEEERFPHEYWEGLAEEGMLGLTIPKEHGGSGLGLLDLALAAETLAESGAGVGGGAVFVVGPVFGGFLLQRHGSKEQMERYLPSLAQGEEIWAGAFTEEGSGSNVSAIGTRAESAGDRYLVNGEKNYVGAASIAQHVVILARTAPREQTRKTRGVSLLVADLPNDHVEVRPLTKMGTRWIDTNAVSFLDLEVPRENLIGAEGEAWGPLYDVLNPERIVLAATAVGAGLLCIRRAVEHAKGRIVWDAGAPVGTYQGIQFPLVEAKMRLEAARLKVYEAAWLFDQGAAECATVATMARYLAAHAALHAADRAIQTLGGEGYLVQSGIERQWRDLRLGRIAPVTDELALAYLAQRDLGMPRSY
jgi:acyl-CoA dehydrogenase